MALYSPYPAQRTRQVIADALGVLSVVAVILVATTLAASIRALGEVGRGLESAGESFRDGLTDAGETLGGIPLVGGAVRQPFDAAADAGASVSDAGSSLVELIETLAVIVGWAVALPALLVLVLLWVMPRVRFARRSAEARLLIAAGLSADTLGIRALLHAPLSAVTSVHPDPAVAWRDGDARVVRELAELELRRLGVAAHALP